MTSLHSSRTTSVSACDLSASIGADHSERGAARGCSCQGCTTVAWDGVRLRSTHNNDRVGAPPSPFGLEGSSLGPPCTMRASGPPAKDHASPQEGYAPYPSHEFSRSEGVGHRRGFFPSHRGGYTASKMSNARPDVLKRFAETASVERGKEKEGMCHGNGAEMSGSATRSISTDSNITESVKPPASTSANSGCEQSTALDDTSQHVFDDDGDDSGNRDGDHSDFDMEDHLCVPVDAAGAGDSEAGEDMRAGDGGSEGRRTLGPVELGEKNAAGEDCHAQAVQVRSRRTSVRAVESSKEESVTVHSLVHGGLMFPSRDGVVEARADSAVDSAGDRWREPDIARQDASTLVAKNEAGSSAPRESTDRHAGVESRRRGSNRESTDEPNLLITAASRERQSWRKGRIEEMSPTAIHDMFDRLELSHGENCPGGRRDHPAVETAVNGGPTAAAGKRQTRLSQAAEDGGVAALRTSAAPVHSGVAVEAGAAKAPLYEEQRQQHQKREPACGEYGSGGILGATRGAWGATASGKWVGAGTGAGGEGPAGRLGNGKLGGSWESHFDPRVRLAMGNNTRRLMGNRSAREVENTNQIRSYRVQGAVRARREGREVAGLDLADGGVMPAPVMPAPAKPSGKEDLAGAWEAHAAWRPRSLVRQEGLSEAKTMENIDDARTPRTVANRIAAAPTELRKAWRWDKFPEVARRLNEVADAMAARGFREEAADLFERSVEIYMGYGGPKGHGQATEALNDLGHVLWESCAYPGFTDVADDIAVALMEAAQYVFRRALAACRVNPGREHPFAAVCLSNLADCASVRRGRYDEAKALLQAALRVRTLSLGPRHVETANTLMKLGGLERERGTAKEAEAHYRQALTVYQECLGPQHGDVGSALNLLAVVVGEQGRHVEAEELHRRALAQRRQAGARGPEDLAPMLYNLGLVVGTTARKGPASQRASGEAESEALLREALSVYQEGLGADHLEVADCMDKLAAAVAMNGDLAQAEALHRRALEMMEKRLGADDPRIAEVLFNLSAVVGAQRGRLEETEGLLHRCLYAQKSLHAQDPNHPEVALVLDRLADVIRTRDVPRGRHADKNGLVVGRSPEVAPGPRERPWWRHRSSLTSRGSSWFESEPSARGSVGSRASGLETLRVKATVDADSSTEENGDADAESDMPSARPRSLRREASESDGVRSRAVARASSRASHCGVARRKKKGKTTPVAVRRKASNGSARRRGRGTLSSGCFRRDVDSISESSFSSFSSHSHSNSNSKRGSRTRARVDHSSGRSSRTRAKNPGAHSPASSPTHSVGSRRSRDDADAGDGCKISLCKGEKTDVDREGICGLAIGGVRASERRSAEPQVAAKAKTPVDTRASGNGDRSPSSTRITHSCVGKDEAGKARSGSVNEMSIPENTRAVEADETAAPATPGVVTPIPTRTERRRRHRRYDSVFDSTSPSPTSSRSSCFTDDYDRPSRGNSGLNTGNNGEDEDEEGGDSGSESCDTEATSYSDSVSSSAYDSGSEFSDESGSSSDSSSYTSSGSSPDDVGSGQHTEGDGGVVDCETDDNGRKNRSSLPPTFVSDATPACATPACATPASRRSAGEGEATNCWSDGIFESSGKSSPEGRYRAAAVRTASGAARAASAVPPSMLMSNKLEPSVPALEGGNAVFDAPQQEGATRGEQRFPTVGSLAAEQSGDVAKMEPVGLRKRARAIRGVLLRRGAAAAAREKEKQKERERLSFGTVLGKKGAVESAGGESDLGGGEGSGGSGGGGGRKKLSLRIPTEFLPFGPAPSASSPYELHQQGHWTKSAPEHRPARKQVSNYANGARHTNSAPGEQQQGPSKQQQNRTKLVNSRAAFAARFSGLVPWPLEQNGCARLTSDSDDTEDEKAVVGGDGPGRNGGEGGQLCLHHDGRFCDPRNGSGLESTGELKDGTRERKAMGGGISREENNFFTPVLHLADMASRRGDDPRGGARLKASCLGGRKSFRSPSGGGCAASGTGKHQSTGGRGTVKGPNEGSRNGFAKNEVTTSRFWTTGTSRRDSGTTEDEDCLPKSLEALGNSSKGRLWEGKQQQQRRQQQQQQQQEQRPKGSVDARSHRPEQMGKKDVRGVPRLQIPMRLVLRNRVGGAGEIGAREGSPEGEALSISTGDRKSDASWLECVAFSPPP